MDIHKELNKFGNEGAHFSVEVQTKQGKGLLSIPHYHDCVEILYGLTGLIDVIVNETSHIVNPGDMIVIFTDEVHRVNTLSPSENKYAVLKYDPEILYSTSQSASETKFLATFAAAALTKSRVFSAETMEATPMRSIIKELLQEEQADLFGGEIATRLGLCQLFLWILRSWKSMDEKDPFITTNKLDAITTLQKIYDYVDNEYMNKVTVETVAAQLNMSYYSFSKFFAANTKKSFPRYLNEVRLTKSKILLTSTDMNITEIALEVGFISSSHFIQRFKESNQMTPQQFRKEFLK